jgi:transposase
MQKMWRLKMAGKRKRHTASFKAKVALEAAKEMKTLNELATQYGVHSTQISQWKSQLLEALPEVFGSRNSSKIISRQLDGLYRQIGEVTVERDWLKKKLQILP